MASGWLSVTLIFAGFGFEPNFDFLQMNSEDFDHYSIIFTQLFLIFRITIAIFKDIANNSYRNTIQALVFTAILILSTFLFNSVIIGLICGLVLEYLFGSLFVWIVRKIYGIFRKIIKFLGFLVLALFCKKASNEKKADCGNGGDNDGKPGPPEYEHHQVVQEDERREVEECSNSTEPKATEEPEKKSPREYRPHFESSNFYTRTLTGLFTRKIQLTQAKFSDEVRRSVPFLTMFSIPFLANSLKNMASPTKGGGHFIEAVKSLAKNIKGPLSSVKAQNVLGKAGGGLIVVSLAIDGYGIAKNVVHDMNNNSSRNTVKKTITTASGAAGGLGGCGVGAAIGTAILPGIGTFFGSLIGGLFGGSTAAVASELASEVVFDAAGYNIDTVPCGRCRQMFKHRRYQDDPMLCQGCRA